MSFYNYAGIHRPVKLLALPKERVLDFEVTHRLVDGGAEVDYTVTTNGSHDVTVEVLDGTTCVARVSGKAALKITNAKLWNVTPYLQLHVIHRITDGVTIDEYFDKIGIRTFGSDVASHSTANRCIYLVWQAFGPTSAAAAWTWLPSSAITS